MKTFLPVLLLCVAIHSGFAQPKEKVIEFTNPSFEDFPRASSPPIHWYNCGFPGESPPDVQPDPTFNVTQPAYEGKTYLGMVVRDNNTWEAVSQKLSQPMKKDYVYQLEVYLARSDFYWSVSRVSEKETNYAMPVRFRVFGGFSWREGEQFLAETPPVTHTEWKSYVLELEPAEEAYDHIILEAYYDDRIAGPYCGNVLVDNLSPLIPLRLDISKFHKNIVPKFTKRLSPITPARDADADLQIMNKVSKTSQKPAPENTIQPAPVSETELVQIVETSAPRIAFDSSGSLKTALYNDHSSGQEKQVNLPLQSMVEALNQHSLATLIIVIVEKDAALAEKKRQSLRTALSQMGGRQDQIIIRNWLEKDAEKTWLGDPASGVLLRLIR